jgi:hypothetical protein
VLAGTKSRAPEVLGVQIIVMPGRINLVFLATTEGIAHAGLIDQVKASFVSTGSIPIGMDKYNKKIMIVILRDPDLFRVEN